MSEKEEQRKNLIANAIANAMTSRSSMFQSMFNPERDLDAECGYPVELSLADYITLYKREGISTRAVSIFPEESWITSPLISDEIKDDEYKEHESSFEKEWKQLQNKHHIFSVLQRADVLSGIGQFGVVLLGLDDGEDLSKPVTKKNLELIYLKTYSQEHVTIASTENDPTSERYGLPEMYKIEFKSQGLGAVGTDTVSTKTISVHYSRIIHIADNRAESDVFGIPRMQSLFNRLYDLRKILGGSAEMFWKGAFPGYSFEVDSNAGNEFEGVEVDTDSIRAEFERYSNGLQRYLALEGVKAKSLSPQVADPSQHVDTQLKVVALCMGVPHRIFIGSEEAKLASSEDTKRWNARINRRREQYLTPYILQPLIERLIEYGILPDAEYTIEWEDLNAPTPKQKAEIFEIKARAMTQLINSYMSGAPFTMKDLYYLSKDQGLTKEEFNKVVSDINDREEMGSFEPSPMTETQPLEPEA